MQTSDYINTISHTLKASFIVCASLLGIVWLNQQSLEQHWSLHFHRESPWSSVSSPIWKQGAGIMRAAESAKDVFIAQLWDPSGASAMLGRDRRQPLNSDPLTSPLAVDIGFGDPKSAQQLSRWITARRHTNALQPEENPAFTLAGPLYNEQGAAILPAGKQVLFIGDSMMEGIAPWGLKLLKDTYQVTGVNLSKRSTGLTYPSFFNWPETTADALGKNTHIGLLAVFLGPNDPWDMPVGKGKPYLRFGSEAWQEAYRGRIRQILSLTQKHHIPVIWVLPPNMRKDKLNRDMAVLDALYESEVLQVGGVVLRVNDLFGYQDSLYSETAMINNKRVHVRAGDGIHYTPAGMRIIAEAIIGNIHVIPQENEGTHDE